MAERPRQSFGAQVLPNALFLTRINQLVAANYKGEVVSLTTVVKEPKKGLLVRKAAMSRCRQLGEDCLTNMRGTFRLSHVGFARVITTQIRMRRKDHPVFAKTRQRIRN